MTELIEQENNLILVSLLITVCMQLCFFAIAYALKMDKVTDFAGTSNFIVLAAFTLWLGNDFSLPKILATLMVCLWGFRLGGYLFYRILIWGEDHRFDKMREKFWSFLGFWIMQMLWVFLLSLPVTYFNGMTGNFELTNLSYIGVTMFGIGFVIESMADYTKFKHKLYGEKWCRTGIWAISRHPNYFGNIFLWSGIYVYCYSHGVALWTIIGLIWIIILLLFMSGINLLEASANLKYGNDAEYNKYKSETSMLIPIPKSIYSKIPESIQRTFLLDFKMYK